MQKKIAISLLLIVLLPVGLLGWFGARTVRNEQQVLQHQLQILLNAQLKTIDDTIHAYFQSEQVRLLDDAEKLQYDPASIRAFVRESPQVRQIMVIAPDNKRLFPPVGAPLSDAEQQFLQRTAAVWDDPRLLQQGDATTEQDGQSSRQGASSLGRETGERGRHGWYAWHWNAELHHIFWWRAPDRRLVGFELSPVRVMSDIIGRLPASGSADDALGEARVRLVNSNGQIAYQWGRYEPRENEPRLAVLPLSAPLSSWKLEYYGTALKSAAAGNRFGLGAGMLAVVLALGGLAWYLYREHTREIRIARQRVNFVNQVSHELKTPLTNIRMYAELLEQELGDEEDKPRKYIGIISAESQRLSRLIANVLSFAREQREQLTLHRQACVVDEIIARCIDAFMPALSAKGIAVRFDANAGALVQVDPEALEQILNNLIGNVEKYAASGGKIDISSRYQPHRTIITVRDFGPGIPRQERERVFQPFYRISSRLSDGVAGTGIGLGIARQLARLHGGDLQLETMDRGACFKLTLHTETARNRT